ncbi:TrbC/VirB2 family protein [Candidatus Saccharibacteria bacterium]|nr:TrbC/VirB2 family protein [Candidatus Saccharibacteria bacterium]
MSFTANYTLKQVFTVLIVLLSLVLFTNKAFALNFASGDTCANESGTARSKCEACQAAGAAGFDTSNSNCQDAAAGTPTDKIDTLATKIVNIISWVVGIAAVIMIMVGGFKYITSQGDGNSISGAKNTILYAIIGLVIVLFAQIIVRFVINKV